MPGAAVGALILIVGFANGNRLLLGFGLFALLGFVSHYYYSLQLTLLIKSLLLIGLGVLLLAVRWPLMRCLDGASRGVKP